MIGIRFQVPNATLDYSIVWKGWLTAGETIAGSEWDVSPEGTLTIDDESQSTTDAIVWLTGGTLGASYLVTNTITTNSTPPRIDSRTFQIVIKE